MVNHQHGEGGSVDTIIDYVHNETRSFRDFAFCAADALVFALLTYDQIPAQVPSLAEVEHRYGTLADRIRSFSLRHPLKSLAALARVPYEGVPMRQVESDLSVWERSHPDVYDGPTGFVDPHVSHAFYRDTARNPRFASVRMNVAEEVFSRDQQTQFAAETFLLPTDTLVIAFRGTDDSLVGWREDFNMIYQYPIPAQRTAAEYLERVARLWPRYRIILTGHSKGGNLAVYAAMNASDDVKDRIEQAYSLDGPGFARNVTDSYEYSTVIDRITKIVPESSIIGMLLEAPPNERRIVVRSTADGISQHSGFSWIMDNDVFVTAPQLSESSQAFNTAINEWLQGMSPHQRRKAVDALFRVVEAGGHGNISEIISEGIGAIPGILGTYVGLDGEERRYINQAARILAGAMLARGPISGGEERTIEPDDEGESE